MDKILLIYGLLDYDNQENPNLYKKEIKKKAWSAIIALIIIFLLGIIYFISYSYEWEDMNNTIKDVLGVSSLFLLIYSFLFVVCYIIGVIKNWTPQTTIESRVIDAFDKGNQSVVNTLKNELSLERQVEIKQCKACEKYKESKKMISELLDRYKSHKDFINYYQKVSGANVNDLNGVHKEFSKESTYAKFLCVLSNSQYYNIKDENQLKSLTDYFISFYPAIQLKGKRIKRVFSKSVIKEKKKEIVIIKKKVEGKEKEESIEVTKEKEVTNKEKSKWLLQYLLSNVITGVETYLLVNEKELKCHLDYIVGKTTDPNTLIPISTAYFSCEEEGGDYPDATIISNDQLLISVLEEDFYNRLYGSLKNNQKRKVIAYNPRSSIYDICEEIEMNIKDVGDVAEQLVKYINHCDQSGINPDHRNKLVKTLKEVYGAYLLDFFGTSQKVSHQSKQEIKWDLLDKKISDKIKKKCNLI